MKGLLVASLAVCLAGCLVPYQPWDTIEGEHVILLLNDPSVSRNRCAETVRAADDAYDDVVRETGLPFTATLVLCWASDGDAWGLSGRHYVAVRPQVLDGGAEAVARVLRHEIAHLVAMSFFGEQESICLSEGFAEYIAFLREPDVGSEPRGRVAELLGISYAEWRYCGAVPGFETDVVYGLAAAFAAFWCERYGLSSFYALYDRADTTGFAADIAAVSGETFDEIMAAFEGW